MSLEDIRKEIDALDEKIVPLLKERMNCSLKVAKEKREQGLEIYHPKREEEIINRVNEKGGEFGSYIAGVYREIMGVSREAQQIELTPMGSLASTIVNAKDGIEPIGVSSIC